MRLAYLCSDPGIPASGVKGASVHFREMACALRASGVEVDAWLARGPVDESVFPGVSIVAPSPGPRSGRELRTLANSAAMLEALESGAPHDAVYERLSLFGAAGATYAAARRIPFVVEVNAPLWDEAARFRSLDLRQGARGLALDVLRAADHVIVVSTSLGSDLVAEGVERDKIVVSGNGARLTSFDRAEPEARPVPLRGKPILLFVGSLKPWHGVEFLIEAFEVCRRDRAIGLRIVGDGPMRQLAEDAAERWPNDVWFDGAVAHDRIPGILVDSDVVVAPYSADAPTYFSPLKVMEAIAARRPLLAARTGCVLDSVAGAPGVTLYDPDDCSAFAQGLDDILEHGCREIEDGEFRRRIDWSRKAGLVFQLLGKGRRPAEVTA